ncbi:MAG: DUF3841 domain-containing protein [Deltaproteobacteria bacterium]|nr:DUF3841 domain-containing protein [Deltaproteobacteria bacterium]
MILWTIQTERAWLELQNRGILRTRRENITEESWLQPYQWMVEQMEINIGPPPRSWCFPLWAWFQWEGEKRRRPDLRAGGHLGKGETGIRIEFECFEGSALLSDFDLWHYVLNYWHLPKTEQDAEQFEAELSEQGLNFFIRNLFRIMSTTGRLLKAGNAYSI